MPTVSVLARMLPGWADGLRRRSRSATRGGVIRGAGLQAASEGRSWLEAVVGEPGARGGGSLQPVSRPGPPRATVRPATLSICRRRQRPVTTGNRDRRRAHDPARLRTGAARLDCSATHAGARLRRHEMPGNVGWAGAALKQSDGDKRKPLDLAHLLSEVLQDRVCDPIGLDRIGRYAAAIKLGGEDVDARADREHDPAQRRRPDRDRAARRRHRRARQRRGAGRALVSPAACGAPPCWSSRPPAGVRRPPRGRSARRRSA